MARRPGQRVPMPAGIISSRSGMGQISRGRAQKEEKAMRKRKAMKGDSTLTFDGNTNGRSRPFSRPWSSLHCIIPPHMLESIAMRGTEAQRAAALETLAIDQTFRSMRAGARMLAPPRRGQPGLTAEECAIHRTIYDAHHAQSLPGSVVRTEGQPATGDASVDE